MKRKIDMQELRQIQLSILDDVHEFCTQNGLKYSLAGGTLLGAIRHKGYIPWDDDIDLIMPRTDYESFIRTYQSERNEIIELRKVDYCVELFCKVCRKNTIMTDLLLGRDQWGINIDIFPVDGCPENYVEEAETIRILREKLAKICPYYKTAALGKRIPWFLKYCIKRILYFYPHSVKHLKREIDNIAYREDLFEGEKAGVKIGGHGIKEMLDNQVYRSYSLIEFEGKSYYIISDYAPFLIAMYGDYMKLPPKEKQVTHHLYDAFIIE